MKNFVTLAITAMLMVLSIAETSALTSHNNRSALTSTTEHVTPELFQNFFFQTTTTHSEIAANIHESTPITQDNLNLLYFICIALVLVNLIAQVKIIYQMIHLFFQFKKQDDLGQLTY